MRETRTLQAAKYGYILLSVLISALGIALIAVPDFSASMLCWMGGILLMAFGLVKILGYLSKDLYRLAFQFDLAFGIFMMALGLILILRRDAHIICILLGLGILADALLKIQIAIDAKVFGIRLWWAILSAAIVTGVVGFALIFRPYESGKVVMMLLGSSFLAEGILNLITVLTAVKILKKTDRELGDDYVQL